MCLSRCLQKGLVSCLQAYLDMSGGQCKQINPQKSDRVAAIWKIQNSMLIFKQPNMYVCKNINSAEEHFHHRRMQFGPNAQFSLLVR